MQRYFVKDKIDNYLLLSNDDIHHIKNVMRNKVGDLIECIYNNELYICEILDTNNNKVLIKELIEENNEYPFDLTIGIALVKEQKMDLILQKLTELGVTRIIPLKMERSIVKIDNKKLLSKKIRWEKICKEASEQSKRTKIPIIEDITTIKELDKYNYKNKYICSLTTNNIPEYNILSKINDNIIFIIGPEGGISPKEEELLERMNYQKISLGNRVLRVETAAIYIASIINYCTKR